MLREENHSDSWEQKQYYKALLQKDVERAILAYNFENAAIILISYTTWQIQVEKKHLMDAMFIRDPCPRLYGQAFEEFHSRIIAILHELDKFPFIRLGREVQRYDSYSHLTPYLLTQAHIPFIWLENIIHNRIRFATPRFLCSIFLTPQNNHKRIFGSAPVKSMAETRRKARLIGQDSPGDVLISAAFAAFNGPDIFGVVRNNRTHQIRNQRFKGRGNTIPIGTTLTTTALYFISVFHKRKTLNNRMAFLINHIHRNHSGCSGAHASFAAIANGDILPEPIKSGIRDSKAAE
ncbi:hypothetical protein LXL04_034831 [Taraxacum kok-saghyz]